MFSRMKIIYPYRRRMRSIAIRLPEELIDKIDDLIIKGVFITRSEFVRYAILQAFKELCKKGILEIREIVEVKVE